jgi:uncharacterized protein YuzE
MEIKYFPDTDTLLIRFSQATIAETRDLTDDVLVEFDEAGQLVSMTIEQAKTRAGLETVSFQTLPAIGPIVLDPERDKQRSRQAA